MCLGLHFICVLTKRHPSKNVVKIRLTFLSDCLPKVKTMWSRADNPPHSILWLLMYIHFLPKLHQCHVTWYHFWYTFGNLLQLVHLCVSFLKYVYCLNYMIHSGHISTVTTKHAPFSCLTAVNCRWWVISCNFTWQTQPVRIIKKDLHLQCSDAFIMDMIPHSILRDSVNNFLVLCHKKQIK